MSFWSVLDDIGSAIWPWGTGPFHWVFAWLSNIFMWVLNGFLEIFLFWVKKNIRIQVFILRDEAKQPLADPADLDYAIDNAKAIFDKGFNVRLKFYGSPGVQTLSDIPPAAALDTYCSGAGYLYALGAAGGYFEDNLAGWVFIPISLKFPVSVFVIRSIDGKIGCSHAITDYLTLAATNPDNPTDTGLTDRTTLAHELGHACTLSHRDDRNNLLYANASRGTSTTWWQRRVARISRHCTFW
jgi:hypothetical protein